MLSYLFISFLSQNLQADTASLLLGHQLDYLHKPEKLVNEMKIACSNENEDIPKILPNPKNIDDTLEKIEEIEQICSHGDEQQKQMIETIKAYKELYARDKDKLKKFGLNTVEDYQYGDHGQITMDLDQNKALKKTKINTHQLKKTLEKQKIHNEKNPTQAKYYNGITSNDLKTKVQKNFPQENNLFYQQKTDQDKCEFLKYAYFNAVYELSLLAPSKAYNGSMDDLLMPLNPTVDQFKDYERDKIRASWALRNFLSLKKEDIPKDCKTKAGRAIYDEAMLRFESIVILPAQKKPLGFALGMCGRSMTGHSFDEESPMRKETDICFSEVHKNALLSGQILKSE
jgi:hypothetical protein